MDPFSNPVTRIRSLASGLPVAALALLAGCADDAEPPRVEKPAIIDVATGDVGSRKEYVDKVEENNRRNDERGARGDWSYVRPAVGPKE